MKALADELNVAMDAFCNAPNLDTDRAMAKVLWDNKAGIIAYLRALSAPAASTGEPVIDGMSINDIANGLIGIQEDLPSEDDRNLLGYAAHYLRKSASGDVRAAVIEALTSIAGWRTISTTGEYEGGLRDIIRCMADRAQEALQSVLSQAPATDEAQRAVYSKEIVDPLINALRNARNYIDSVIINSPDPKKRRNFGECLRIIESALKPVGGNSFGEADHG